jgi:hypothetical protein
VFAGRGRSCDFTCFVNQTEKLGRLTSYEGVSSSEIVAEIDFERLAVPMPVHDRADLTPIEANIGPRSEQRDGVE